MPFPTRYKTPTEEELLKQSQELERQLIELQQSELESELKWQQYKRERNAILCKTVGLTALFAWFLGKD